MTMQPQDFCELGDLLRDFRSLPPARQQDMLTWGRWMVCGPRTVNQREFYRRFGARLCAFRIFMGFRSPNDFAAYIGMKAGVYVPYEKGERKQGAAINRVIVKLIPLGVSLDWLFGDGSKSPMVHPVYTPPHIQRRNALHVIDGGAS